MSLNLYERECDNQKNELWATSQACHQLYFHKRKLVSLWAQTNPDIAFWDKILYVALLYNCHSAQDEEMYGSI